MIQKKLPVALMALFFAFNANAQFGKIKINKKAIDAIDKGVKAATFSDADAFQIARQSVEWMDKNNPVAGPKDKYTVRLNKIFGKHKNEDGLALNYKVYKVVDINAFACADGSVRVFSALMDMMTDDELLAIIGHEIGHVKNHDTKDAIKAAYTRAALKDAVASQSGVIQALSETQLGEMSEAILSSKHSRKQETEADSYSYDFLKKHGYNVMGAYNAFMKLAKLEDQAGAQQTKAAKMFSSHPDSKKRAAEIVKKAKEDGLYKEPNTK